MHDIANDDRSWRHLNFWQYNSYLHTIVPRVHCDVCDKIRTVHVDWSRPTVGFTMMFEAEVMQLMKEMPVAAVTRKAEGHDARLWLFFIITWAKRWNHWTCPMLIALPLMKPQPSWT
ncbi:helix-turn-helix domain-containing protein [Heyndrickxia coagulans]